MTNANPWTTGGLRVLFVHAHPDDETLATGAGISRLVEIGSRVRVVTATRGERGEVVPGVLPAGADLSGAREREVASAISALGVHEHRYLGAERRFLDSGMMWGSPGRAVAAPDAPADALTRAPLAEVVAALIAQAQEFAAGILVSYADDGGYGHPDHVACSRAARRAAARLGLPFYAVIHPDAPDADVEINATEYRARIRAALRAHRTQLTLAGETITHSGGQRQDFPSRERYRLVDPGEPGGVDDPQEERLASGISATTE